MLITPVLLTVPVELLYPDESVVYVNVGLDRASVITFPETRLGTMSKTLTALG